MPRDVPEDAALQGPVIAVGAKAQQVQPLRELCARVPVDKALRGFRPCRYEAAPRQVTLGRLCVALGLIARGLGGAVGCPTPLVPYLDVVEDQKHASRERPRLSVLVLHLKIAQERAKAASPQSLQEAQPLHSP